MVKTVQNFLIILKNFQQVHLKAFSKRFSQNHAEATGDLIGNKIANKITGFQKKLQQNNSETVTNKNDKEILKRKICVSR